VQIRVQQAMLAKNISMIGAALLLMLAIHKPPGVDESYGAIMEKAATPGLVR
jgi:hypothetical protein